MRKETPSVITSILSFKINNLPQNAVENPHLLKLLKSVQSLEYIGIEVGFEVEILLKSEYRRTFKNFLTQFCNLLILNDFLFYSKQHFSL